MLSKKILQKIIDNLNSEKPDISYIRGILETLIEGLPEEKLVDCVSTKFVNTNSSDMPLHTVTFANDEGAHLDMQAKAKLAKVKELSKYE